MALHLATRPELPREGGEAGERCGYRIEPGPGPRRFFAPAGARLWVLEGPAGLPVGYFQGGSPAGRVELLRLAHAVAPCRPGPAVRFRPAGPFGIYAGPHATDRDLAVWPARSAKGEAVYLLTAPGVLLALAGAKPGSPI